MTMPLVVATVLSSFVTTLDVEKEGRVVFVLPTVLNPRYSPSNLSPSVTVTMPSIASVSTKYSFDFELDVQCASPIQEIISPCHRLKVDVNPDDNRQAIVRLDESYKFDADVQVHVLCSKPFEPCALVENGVTKFENNKIDEFLSNPVIMLNFFPSFDSCASLERGEFIFVVDRSGSMGGSNIESAKQTLLLFLKSLPEECYFNVIGFGSSFQKLFQTSEIYNDSSLNLACSLAQSMKADLGGTEILQPLRDVFSQPLIPGYPRQIFVLTDGAVQNTQQVIELVRKNVNNARCFAFGIGEGASTALVKGMARAGRGIAEFVGGQDRLQSKVMKTLKNALQPAIKDVQITWALPKAWEIKTVPSTNLTVFCGNELVVFGMLTRKDGTLAKRQIVAIEGTATLSGNIDAGEHLSAVQYNVKFSAVCGNPADKSLLLHRLCAKMIIREVHEDDDMVIQLSKSANVVSKLTSFVAVDKQSRVVVSRPIETPTRQNMYGGGRVFACMGPAPRSGGWPASMAYCNAVPQSTAGFGGGYFSSRPCSAPQSSGLFGCGGGGPPPPPPPRDLSRSRDLLGFGGGGGPPPSSPHRGLPRSRDLRGFGGGGGPPPPPPPRDLPRSRDLLGFGGGGGPPPPPLIPPQTSMLKTYLPGLTEGYSSLITLQTASGSWQLTNELANVCGLSLDELIQACPSQLTTHNKDSLWATAIALSCLAGKFAGQKDEWEMVAAKGTKWLKAKLSAERLGCDELMNFASRVLKFR